MNIICLFSPFCITHTETAVFDQQVLFFLGLGHACCFQPLHQANRLLAVASYLAYSHLIEKSD